MTFYDIPDHITGNTWNGLADITFVRNNSAIDLTGASVEMFVKSYYNLASPKILNLFSPNSGILLISPTSAGIINIPKQIVDIPVGRYVWGITLNLSGGEVKTYLMGNWRILPPVPYIDNWQIAPRIL